MGKINIDNKDLYDHKTPDKRTRKRLEQLLELGMEEISFAQFGIEGVVSGLYIEQVWTDSNYGWDEYILYVKELLLKKEEEKSKKSLLKELLTIEKQEDILGSLFGFHFHNHRNGRQDHFVLYNEEGEEFYGNQENCKWNFSTLEGIFAYAAHQSEERGLYKAQRDIRKCLGIQS